ncbi:hypothetical protein NDU88_000241 [Pleurodeles waltl]|uniref:Uncharacterized protein n=1 Tax=Pleurodeles waltl TaxID=8319 RepID=A0AAV7KP01_PLEWA|nr:hypothetical protein NDU88_000241 [Pleurodeles waltl]
MLEKARHFVARQGKEWVNQQMMEALEAGAPKKRKGGQEVQSRAKWGCIRESCVLLPRPNNMWDSARTAPLAGSVQDLGQGGSRGPKKAELTRAGCATPRPRKGEPPHSHQTMDEATLIKARGNMRRRRMQHLEPGCRQLRELVHGQERNKRTWMASSKCIALGRHTAGGTCAWQFYREDQRGRSQFRDLGWGFELQSTR